MPARTYETPEAFKQALEQRLRQASTTGHHLLRKRQLLVFERFLVRVFAALGDAVALKGGLVLEHRIMRARSTKDVDLRVLGNPAGCIVALRTAMLQRFDDFMTFDMREDPEHPNILSPGMVYQGLRFRIECRLASKIYGQPFGMDLAFGDPICGLPDAVTAADSLDFAGIAPPTLLLYPVETHIAEKLHAYTLPRPRPNTRVKDLPDIALLASIRQIEAQKLRAAILQTFTFRQTHAIPLSLPMPPPEWEAPYARIALVDELRWLDLTEVFAAASAFLDSLLSGDSPATWNPADWSWQTET